MDERRKFERRKINATVEYSGSEGVQCDAVENASIGGFRLRLSAVEQPGTSVTLRVQLLDDSQYSFQTKGIVVWARQAAPYLAGVRFTDLDDDKTARLDDSMRACPIL